MNSIVIDKTKCKQDGLCIAECPYLLFLEGEDKIPVLAKGAQEACINCGHCIAICPGNAITLNTVSTNDCEQVQNDLKLSQDQVSQFIKGRRSIRSYKKQPVEQPVLNSLLDISRWAPSARNGQPVSWIVINSPEKIHALSGMVVEWLQKNNQLEKIVEAFNGGKDMIHRDAPCLLIAHASKLSPRPTEDCSIAMATVEIAAPAFGLGSCWAGFFMAAAKVHQPILEYLNLPEDHEVYAALILGYPKYKYSYIPPRNEAKIDWRV
ncbi:nitroreductase family protein [Desulforhopalus sp. 52FAK]